MNSSEIWLPSIVKEYKVSNFGRILSKHGRILKPQLMWKGYHRICLRLPNHSKKYFYVHRLVADAFLGAVPEGHQVNHKDCNKTNNYVDNLEYVTLHENLEHSWFNGKKREGDQHGYRKLSSSDVAEIRECQRLGTRDSALAVEYGVHKTTISKIRRGILWSCTLAKETEK